MGKKLKNLLLTGILLGEIWICKEIIAPTGNINYHQSTNSNQIVQEVQLSEYHKESKKEQNDKNSKNISNYIDNEIIINIESKGNPKAHNKSEGARGLMQIRPIVLKEWNLLNPGQKYTLNDLFNPDINKKIGTWYFNRIETVYLPNHKLEQNLENKLASYNWGIGNLSNIGDAKKNFSKLPLTTQKYIRKYKKLSDKN